MGSTFSGIELGSRSLQQFQVGLETTGHNIANAKTEGYSRQRVTMKTLDPLYKPDATRAERAGQIGQGMEIAEVKRVRDEFIDRRITTEKTSAGYWSVREDYLKDVEAIHNEPGALTLKSDLQNLWSAWQDVSMNPTERASKNALIERAERITESIRHSFSQLKKMRENADLEIQGKTKRINEIALTIRELNKQILQSQALGDNPNDLLDKRDLLFEELSSIADVELRNTDPNETIVYIGSRHLVQGELVSPLELREDPKNAGMYDVYWQIDGEKASFGGGEMKGLFEVRDIEIVDAMNNLNTMAINMADAVNEIHRDSFGSNLETGEDFFKILPLTESPNGNYDINNDGNISSVLFKAVGTNTLKPKDTIGLSGVMRFGSSQRDGGFVEVAYSEKDRVEEVVQRINDSNSNVVAYLDHRGRLALKAKVYDDYLRPNFTINHIEDSGEFLAGFSGVLNGSGEAGAFSMNEADAYAKLKGDGRNYDVSPYTNPAEWLAVNDKLKRNVDFIAVASGIDTDGDGSIDRSNGRGDGSGALAIAERLKEPFMLDAHSTLDNFYADMIGEIGAKTETAVVEGQKQEAIVSHLENLRQSVSGVNLDEEMAQMVVYQHGYNASARVVSVMDRMLDTIINRMGV